MPVVQVFLVVVGRSYLQDVMIECRLVERWCVDSVAMYPEVFSLVVIRSKQSNQANAQSTRDVDPMSYPSLSIFPKSSSLANLANLANFFNLPKVPSKLTKLLEDSNSPQSYQSSL